MPERVTVATGVIKMMGERYECSDLSVVMGKDSNGNVVLGVDVGRVDAKPLDDKRSVCALRSHRLSQSVLYGDGVVTGFCEVCDERVEIPRIPGGMPVVEAQALLDAVSSDDGTNDAVLMFGVSEKRKVLEGDLRAYQRALLLLRVAEAALMRRVLGP